MDKVKSANASFSCQLNFLSQYDVCLSDLSPCSGKIREAHFNRGNSSTDEATSNI